MEDDLDIVNSGIYIRANGKNVVLEDLGEKERREWLDGLGKDGLIRTIEILITALNVYEQNNPIILPNEE